MDFDRHHDELLASADEVVVLLRRHGADRWAAWLEADAVRIRHGDPAGVDHLLGAFGGMGSLNDLLLHPVNGHDVAESQVGPVNERLRRLTGLLAHHARAVKQELGRR